MPGADWPEGTGRLAYDLVDSTNAEARRRARVGEAGPLWITARRQSDPRGRRGRSWRMVDGDFAASLLMTVDGGPAAAASRSFVAALALHDALAAVTGRADLLALKWPNDVLLAGGKVAGILLETEGPALVIGLGVNLVAAPQASQVEPGALEPVDVAGVTDRSVTPDALMDALAPAFDRWERRRRNGFAPIRTAWLDRCAHAPGAAMTARQPHRTLHGRFETIDATGALVLRTEAGLLTIPAADIHLGDIATACQTVPETVAEPVSETVSGTVAEAAEAPHAPRH